MWFAPCLHGWFLTAWVVTSISRPIHGEAVGTTYCKNSGSSALPPTVGSGFDFLFLTDYSSPTLLCSPDEPTSSRPTSHASIDRSLVLQTLRFRPALSPGGPSLGHRSPGAGAHQTNGALRATRSLPERYQRSTFTRFVRKRKQSRSRLKRWPTRRASI
jgi:hypothetical protein